MHPIAQTYRKLLAEYKEAVETLRATPASSEGFDALIEKAKALNEQMKGIEEAVPRDLRRSQNGNYVGHYFR